MDSYSSLLNKLLVLVIIVASLFLAREVLLPVTLAGILSFMLAPLVRMLQHVRLPRGLAVVSVVLLAFAAIFALGTVMAREVTQLAGDLPRYQATITAKIERLSGSGEGGTAGTLKRAEEVIQDLGKEISKGRLSQQTLVPVEVHEPSGGPLQTLSTLISPLLSPLATTGLIVVFVIFILIQREDLRNRMIRIAGSTDIPHTTAAIDDAAHRLSHLFLAQLAINTGFATLIGLGLWWIGIPNAFLWGVLAGILRFVPYLGAILGMVFPLVLALSVDPGWSMVLWTLGLFLGLEALTGQIIEPIFEGHSTGLSPVAVVLSATFWAWLWGPVGLVIATPLTVILVVLGRHIEAFKFVEVLLGDEPALSEPENFYQRMLARDPVEAVEQAKSFMAKHSLSDYCDEIARPALILAQKDVERGVLEKAKAKAFCETVDALFMDIAHEHWVSRKEAHAMTITAAAKLPILEKDQLTLSWRSKDPLLLVGVHSELDEAAARVLETLSEIHGMKGRVERPEALAAPNLAKLDLSGTALICLSSIDMKTPAHIHYAARRLKNRAPHAKMLLGVWSRTDDKALADVKEAVNADYIARSFQEAAAIILEEATAGHRTESNIQPTRAAKPELVRQLVAKDSVQGRATEH
jgi:predicted PurR-regulated permease PerM